MAFIQAIPEERAEDGVNKMYDANRAASAYLPNYVQLFSLRPHVMEAWGQLVRMIRRDSDDRRYELVTLAAARALRSSYCMLVC